MDKNKWRKWKKGTFLSLFIDHPPFPLYQCWITSVSFDFNFEHWWWGKGGCHLCYNYQFSPLFLSKIVCENFGLRKFFQFFFSKIKIFILIKLVVDIITLWQFITCENYDFTTLSRESYNFTTLCRESYNFTTLCRESYNVMKLCRESYNFTTLCRESYNFTTLCCENFNFTTLSRESYNLKIQCKQTLVIVRHFKV